MFHIGRAGRGLSLPIGPSEDDVRRRHFIARLSPVDEAKLNIIVRTKGGASIYSWSFGISVRCSDNNRPAPLTEPIPSDLATNVFTNVGSVEIAEYREPNYPSMKVRRCP